MALSCTISEIKQDIGRKSWFFHTPMHSTPPVRGSLSEYSNHVWYGKTRMVGLPENEKRWGYVWPFRQNTDVWQTERRTDRQTSWYGIVRAMHRRRAVKTDSPEVFLRGDDDDNVTTSGVTSSPCNSSYIRHRHLNVYVDAAAQIKTLSALPLDQAAWLIISAEATERQCKNV